MSGRWLIIGGGPSRVRWADAMNGEGRVRVACANAGIDVCRDAGLYTQWVWLSDPVAIARYAGSVRDMRERGTQLVTSDTAVINIETAGLTVDLAFHTPAIAGRHPFVYRSWCRPMFSGLMLLQAVVNTQDVREVALAGFDGYAAGEKNHGDTEGIIRPFMQSMVEALPRVRFVWVAEPRYAISGDNVEVVR